MPNSENNKRIAKNTGMLYFRMLLMMAISLYTSRIVLNTLGIEDFGIYNVVGGIVTMLGFMNIAMASATQRFLSFEIGKKDTILLNNVFKMSLNIHFILAFLILFFSETVGFWFVNTQIIIPKERLDAAIWVYQFSILTLMVNVISVPYDATIIAHERMKVYAWISIIEVTLKLIIVFLLQWFGMDKLKLYAILIFCISIIIRLIYGFYCSRNFKESKYQLYWNKQLFKTLINYLGWNLLGTSAGVIMGQGINVFLNIFFGPVVNAARGISYQVKVAVNRFTLNFQMAMNPQIVKLYAANDLNNMHQLIFQGAKFSFFLLFIISFPILLETEFILKLWLHIVPDYTVIFTKLLIINALIDSVIGPLMTSVQATGRIKYYQIVVSGLQLSILPISYLFLKLGYPPQTTIYVNIIISIFSLNLMLIFNKYLVNLSILEYFKHVILKIVLVIIISFIFPFLVYHLISSNISNFIIVITITLLSTIISIYKFGLSGKEQEFLKYRIDAFFSKKLK